MQPEHSPIAKRGIPAKIWESFRDQCISPDAPELQQQEMYIAFISGMRIMLIETHRIVNHMNEHESERQLAFYFEELEEMVDGFTEDFPDEKETIN